MLSIFKPKAPTSPFANTKHPTNPLFFFATLQPCPSPFDISPRSSHFEDSPLLSADPRLIFHFRHGTDQKSPSHPFTETHSKIPPFEEGAATGTSSPALQHRYETRRPPTTPGATTSHPKNSEVPSDLSPEFIVRRPMLTAPPIEGNSDCRARPFHSELYFDQEAMRQQLELRDSYDLLQRYHLEHLMTPCEFFYPIVALNFYQSMTTCGVLSPTAIHFTIDGRHGILEARHIVEALQIPFEPVDPSASYQWSPISQRDMVSILSKGTSTDSIPLGRSFHLGYSS
ncbi:hypothetical protein CK203_045262 [Vitis vinifera]|uniref:Uncharacterized protein n=1 Tax=Vitis vinifera TaxID=29760 RepID=A0A438HID8_VITVI|nr:hypothetical protein CK203_045262 [Vitis vinifera]